MGQRTAGEKKVKKWQLWTPGILILFAAGLHMAGRMWEGFSDFYVDNIFPLWVETYGRITGSIPFSVGEWMLAAGILLGVLALALGMVWAGIGAGAVLRRVFRGAGRRMEEGTSERNGEIGRLRRFSRGFGYFFAWTISIVCLVMTLNCFILYHASTFSEHYFGEDTGEYTLVELIEVYNMVAEQCNRLAGEIERDEDGMAVYGGSPGEDGRMLDMEDMAREMMRRLGETYPQLDGYYPRLKALLSSDRKSVV